VLYAYAQAEQITKFYRYVVSRGIKRGRSQWTQEEDAIIREKTEAFGLKWSKIAEFLPGRMGKQIRERFLNHLAPELVRGPWSEEEKRLLLDAVGSYGQAWVRISKQVFNGRRSENECKNVAMGLLRKGAEMEV
jgi:hypothetical protein